jgi:hypothetical protein
MRFESRKGLKKEKKGKTMFCKLKSLYFSYYFFIIPFHLNFKDDF